MGEEKTKKNYANIIAGRNLKYFMNELNITNQELTMDEFVDLKRIFTKDFKCLYLMEECKSDKNEYKSIPLHNCLLLSLS